MPLNLTKDLTEGQQEVYDKLRADLYTFITVDSDFPEWKQANYSERYTTLSVLKIEGTITTEEQTELDAIISVISWKNGLITQRDTIKNDIFNSTSIPSARIAADTFVFTPAPFDL